MFALMSFRFDNGFDISAMYVRMNITTKVWILN